MKKTILTAALSLIALTAVAQQSSPVPVLLPPAPGFAGYTPAIPMRDTPLLEKIIKQKLQERVGWNDLQQFSVDWRPSSLKCLAVEPSEMDPDKVLRICEIKAYAFQIEAKAAIIKNDSGYDVSIIYAHIE